MDQNPHKNVHPGQLENTEEVLRKHYFMAKATQKTQHSMLSKPESPQKHMIKSKTSKMLALPDDDQQIGNLNKKRGQKIDELTTQAASLMRLNAAWGLEEKGPKVDRYRAVVT